jgi:agmatinase
VSKGKVVGVDLVEVAPEYDHAQVTALGAAQLLVDLLAALFPPDPR